MVHTRGRSHAFPRTTPLLCLKRTYDAGTWEQLETQRLCCTTELALFSLPLVSCAIQSSYQWKLLCFRWPRID